MRSNAVRQITLPELNGGINVHDPEYDIADNQSPDMLNLWYKDMALCKRPGQERLCERSIYRMSDRFAGSRVMHAGTKLYRWNADGILRRMGEFDPTAGYPVGVRIGDYAVASAAGELRGVAFEEGDIAIYGGVQAISLTVAGWVSIAGSAAVKVAGADFAGSSIMLDVDVTVGDDAAAVAGKVRTALQTQEAVTTVCEVGGENTMVTLTKWTAGQQDPTLKLTVGKGTCVGLDSTESTDSSEWRNALTEIKDGIADAPGVFCEFGDLLYYLDGTEIWEIDSDYGVKAVEPYVPVVLINALPDRSGGDDNESYNLIGTGFAVWFNGQGGSPVQYYAVSCTTSTFKVSKTLGGAAVNILSAGTAGWRVRKSNGSWISGAPTADAAADTITLAGHGLVAGDVLQFDGGTGSLPGGIDACGLIFHLPQTGLDTSPVKISVDAQPNLVQDQGFTVDYVAGTVDFGRGTAPYGIPAKGTSNVWVTAYKTVAGNKEKIAGCRAAVRFGGETAGVVGGTRVFVMANPGHPYRYWHSDLGLHVSSGMRYFPDTSEEALDQNSEAITAAAKMGDELIIFKENSIFAVGYAFDGQDAYYPVRECHSSIGCDMPGSVQLVDNRLVFAHTRIGVYMLASTNNDLENIVKPISANINPLLLNESGLADACSYDFGRYYWLCAGGRVYLWDYDTTPYYNYADYDKAQRRLAWYRFDNIDAGFLFENGDELCYGGEQGIARFTKNQNDFGQAIPAYFKSKAFDLGSPEEAKTFLYLYPSFSMDGNIKATVTAGNERTDTYAQKDFDISSFDWGQFDWGAFTWNRIKFAKTFAMHLNMRRAAFLQVKVEGNEINRGVGLSGLRVTYYVNRKMR